MALSSRVEKMVSYYQNSSAGSSCDLKIWSYFIRKGTRLVYVCPPRVRTTAIAEPLLMYMIIICLFIFADTGHLWVTLFNLTIYFVNLRLIFKLYLSGQHFKVSSYSLNTGHCYWTGGLLVTCVNVNKFVFDDRCKRISVRHQIAYCYTNSVCLSVCNVAEFY